LVNKTPVGIKNKSLQLFDLQAFILLSKLAEEEGFELFLYLIDYLIVVLGDRFRDND